MLKHMMYRQTHTHVGSVMDTCGLGQQLLIAAQNAAKTACKQYFECHNSKSSAARLQVCEGLTKRFHAVAFKKDGKKLAVLKAGGCLGKSAIAIAPPTNKSRRGEDDALQWRAEMPEARVRLSVARTGAGAPVAIVLLHACSGMRGFKHC